MKDYILGIGYFIIFMFLVLLAHRVYGYDANGDRFCLAQNIYFESANQPLAGRIAVANVTMNRVEDTQFPQTVCGVVYQAKTRTNWQGKNVPILYKCQFSWYCDGKSDEPTDSKTWLKSLLLADQILDGTYEDITEDSLWYHADWTEPYWAEYLSPTVVINDHIFYK